LRPLAEATQGAAHAKTRLPHIGLELLGDAIMEQVRAHLRLLEALSSWRQPRSTIGRLLDGPAAAACPSGTEDMESMPLAVQLRCPLHFGSIGLDALLAAS